MNYSHISINHSYISINHSYEKYLHAVLRVPLVQEILRVPEFPVKKSISNMRRKESGE